MSELVERLMAKYVDRLENEADSIGVDMVQDIRLKIATPVVRNDFGSVIGRSPPGDYPWLETGHLQESEHHDPPTREGNTVVLRIVNDAAYAHRLHDGHDNVAPRPYHSLAMIEWRPLIGPRVKQAMLGNR